MGSWWKQGWQALQRLRRLGAPEAPAPTRATPVPPGDTPAPAEAAPARLASHQWVWEGQVHAYRLWVPTPRANTPPLPLVVMLHGCQQDAADFARGTGMNALAQAQGCLVLYPEQSTRAHRLRCWNWYERAHQGQAGEPALIARLSREVALAHGADPQRIYIAGLSAGGAMAAVVAALYPEQFAALGVHSGLPAGAASHVISAMGVMRRGGAPRAFAGRRPGAMPTIVVHGSADDVVHPDNGEQVAASARAALEASGLALQRIESQEQPAGRRRAQVTRWLDAQGRCQLERWRVEGGLHGWSGGSAEGRFTDPDGPDAAAAMLAFFLQHRRA